MLNTTNTTGAEGEGEDVAGAGALMWSCRCLDGFQGGSCETTMDASTTDEDAAAAGVSPLLALGLLIFAPALLGLAWTQGRGRKQTGSGSLESADTAPKFGAASTDFVTTIDALGLTNADGAVPPLQAGSVVSAMAAKYERDLDESYTCPEAESAPQIVHMLSDKQTSVLMSMGLTDTTRASDVSASFEDTSPQLVNKPDSSSIKVKSVRRENPLFGHLSNSNRKVTLTELRNSVLGEDAALAHRPAGGDIGEDAAFEDAMTAASYANTGGNSPEGDVFDGALDVMVPAAFANAGAQHTPAPEEAVSAVPVGATVSAAGRGTNPSVSSERRPSQMSLQALAAAMRSTGKASTPSSGVLHADVDTVTAPVLSSRSGNNNVPSNGTHTDVDGATAPVLTSGFGTHTDVDTIAAPVLLSGIGTSRSFRDSEYASAIGGEAPVLHSSRGAHPRTSWDSMMLRDDPVLLAAQASTQLPQNDDEYMRVDPNMANTAQARLSFADGMDEYMALAGGGTSPENRFNTAYGAKQAPNMGDIGDIGEMNPAFLASNVQTASKGARRPTSWDMPVGGLAEEDQDEYMEADGVHRTASQISAGTHELFAALTQSAGTRNNLALDDPTDEYMVANGIHDATKSHAPGQDFAGEEYMATDGVHTARRTSQDLGQDQEYMETDGALVAPNSDAALGYLGVEATNLPRASLNVVNPEHVDGEYMGVDDTVATQSARASFSEDAPSVNSVKPIAGDRSSTVVNKGVRGSNSSRSGTATGDNAGAEDSFDVTGDTVAMRGVARAERAERDRKGISLFLSETLEEVSSTDFAGVDPVVVNERQAAVLEAIRQFNGIEGLEEVDGTGSAGTGSWDRKAAVLAAIRGYQGEIGGPGREGDSKWDRRAAVLQAIRAYTGWEGVDLIDGQGRKFEFGAEADTEADDDQLPGQFFGGRFGSTKTNLLLPRKFFGMRSSLLKDIRSVQGRKGNTADDGEDGSNLVLPEEFFGMRGHLLDDIRTHGRVGNTLKEEAMPVTVQRLGGDAPTAFQTVFKAQGAVNNLDSISVKSMAIHQDGEYMGVDDVATPAARAGTTGTVFTEGEYMGVDDLAVAAADADYDTAHNPAADADYDTANPAADADYDTLENVMGSIPTGISGAAPGDVVYDRRLGSPELPPTVPTDTYAVVSKPPPVHLDGEYASVDDMASTLQVEGLYMGLDDLENQTLNVEGEYMGVDDLAIQPNNRFSTASQSTLYQHAS